MYPSKHLAMAKIIFPSQDIVKELPSINYIKKLRTSIYIIVKTLSAFQLGSVEEIKQMHSDETWRRQVSLLNLLIGLIPKTKELKGICLDLGLLTKDGTAAEQSRAIIQCFAGCCKLLEQWRDETELMFPNRLDLLQLIPKPETIDVTQLLGGVIEHDTCATARSLGYKLQDTIFDFAREKNAPNEKLKLYQGECHNHTRCVWFGHISNYLERKLEEHLCEELKLIPNHLHVTCSLSEIVIQVDKEYNLTANYPKGHGDDFNDWLCRYHPLLQRLPTVRVCGDNRQDSDFEGSLPVYDSLDEMLAFTNECLKCSDNALQHCLFITLSSMEVIAQLCVASIPSLSVIVPMRWLAGNTHKLAQQNWGEHSMGCAIDLLHSAFVEIQSDGSLLLDYDFVLKIFCPLYSDLPEFEEYISYYF
jgi:hypothetical protein